MMLTMQKIELAVLVVLIALCAVPAFAEETIIPPSNASAATIDTFNAGILLSNSQKYSEAAAKFREVCEQAPSFAEAQSMYGFCLLRQEKMPEADAALTKAYAINPKIPMTLLNLASVKQSEGQLPEAIDLLNQFLTVNPSGEHAAKARQMLAALTLETKRRGTGETSIGKPDYLAEATAPGFARWEKAQMPISIFIQSGNGVNGYTEEFPKALKEAFNQWIEAAGSAIKIAFVDTPNPEGVTCTWIDDPSQLKNAMEGGEAVISVDTSGAVRRGKLKIMTKNSATGTPEEHQLLLNICLHEVGHILGFKGHSSDTNDVMFGFRASPPNIKLSDRDKSTIRKLYTSPHP